MDVTSKRPRIGSLVRGAVALIAAMTLLLASNGGASSTGTFDLTGITCMDLYLDETPSPPLMKGDPHDEGDRRTTKILSRIEPSASQEGAWDVTSVAYSGPGGLIPDFPPSAETCKVKGDGNELHAGLDYLPVSNDRPTATAKLVQEGDDLNLDYTICQLEGGALGWVRSEFSIVFVDGKPSTQDFGILTATLNVDPPSNPEDPTSCGTEGNLTFNNVIIESTARVGTKGAPQPSLADDWDNDGCSDWNELSTDETAGGKRDPFNPYDIYDVNGDGAITLLIDILEVIRHFAPTGYTAEHGYTPEQEAEYAIYDRGLALGPNGWNRNGPDGKITLLIDILGVIRQAFHDCTDVPN